MTLHDPVQACPPAWLLGMTVGGNMCPQEVAAWAQWSVPPAKKFNQQHVGRARARMDDAARAN